MEKIMNGYISMVDQTKSKEQEKFEKWSKIISPFSNTQENGELQI